MMRISTFYPTALALLVWAATVSGGLIYNGDFEAGNTGFITGYTYAFDLTPSGTIVVGDSPSSYHRFGAFYGDHTTGFSRMLIVNGSEDTGITVWEQTVPVETNTQYVFFYWISTWTDSDVRHAQLKCLINDVQVGVGFAPTAVGEWSFIFHRWNSGANTEAKIRLVDQIRADVNNDFAIDDIDMMDIGDKVFLVTSSTPGGSIPVPGRGVFLYSKGETAWLEAKCDVGYEFAGWSGNVGSKDHLLWVDMDTDRLAVARFKKPDHAVTIRASGVAPNGLSACSDSEEVLSLLPGSLQSDYANGLVLGEPKGICYATYLFPILQPQTASGSPSKVVVNVYGRTPSAGCRVMVGSLGPYSPFRGDMHQSFTGSTLATVLGRAEGPVYWLPVTIDAIMGIWDLAAVYVSYDCPGIPKELLQRFHDHFSIYQALDHYARAPSLRRLYSLQGNEAGTWEALMQTVALAEDRAGSDEALSQGVGTGVEALARLLGRWEWLQDSSDPAALAACNTPAVLEGLDRAVASGQAYVNAYVQAIANGRVSPSEAGDFDAKAAQWREDLAALQRAMAESFEKLAEVHRNATSPKERSLRDTAERMIRALTPWYTGEPDDFGFWSPSSPTYLDQAMQSLQDFPAEQTTVL